MDINMEEYEYLEKNEFLDIISNFVNKEVGKITKAGVIYEDSKIKIFSRYNDILHQTFVIYRVDRKKFLDSHNPDLRDYPNIVFSYGRNNIYNDSMFNDIVRYSREVGYIVPHIINMLYDENYRVQEKVMWTLEN
jgi:hypothetical protein